MSQRYVAYFRVSTQKQGRSGLGLDAQKQAVKDFLQQFGGELVAEYMEVESGKRIDRPEFTKAADYAELAGLLEVLHKDDNRPISNLALFLLATGARNNEARQAKWEDIDVVKRLWRIPAINSKSKKIRTVPLNDAALDVLNNVNTQDEFEYVFINLNTGKPYACVKKAWHRLRAEAGLPKLRLHDLRHQYASMLVNAGRSLYEVQQILGHSDPKVTTRYAHLAPSTLQAAATAAGDKLRFSII